MSLSREIILDALSAVQDPDLGQSIVKLGMVRDIEIDSSGDVSARIVLTTPACPMKAQIEAQATEAIQKLEGVGQVKLKMDSEVKAGASRAALTNRIPDVEHIIAVSSGKGGVGKSTVAVNLACALSKTGARVGILDADIYGPNLPTMLGATDQPMMEKHPTKGEVFVPPVVFGMPLMSMGFLVEGDQPMAWRGPMLHNILQQFCHKVNWGKLDYLILDLPPGTGDVQLSLAQLIPIDGTVVVTTPQEVAMQDVRKAITMFEKVRIPILGVVENMSYFEIPHSTERHYIFGKDGAQEIAKKFNLKVLGQIPIHQGIREGGDLGKPIVVSDPNSSIAQEFISIGGKVAQTLAISNLGHKNTGLEISTSW